MTHETLENNQSHSTISRLGRPPGSLNRPKPIYEADGGTAGAELRQFVERIERLEEERKAIGDDIKDVYLESKGRGFDVRAIRQIIRIRRQDHSERQEQEAILELYMRELGMVA